MGLALSAMLVVSAWAHVRSFFLSLYCEPNAFNLPRAGQSHPGWDEPCQMLRQRRVQMELGQERDCMKEQGTYLSDNELVSERFYMIFASSWMKEAGLGDK